MRYITEMISYVDNSNGCLSPIIVLASYLFEYVFRSVLSTTNLHLGLLSLSTKIVLPAKYHKSALNHIGCSAPKCRENASESSKFPIFWLALLTPRSAHLQCAFRRGAPFWWIGHPPLPTPRSAPGLHVVGVGPGGLHGGQSPPEAEAKCEISVKFLTFSCIKFLI